MRRIVLVTAVAAAVFPALASGQDQADLAQKLANPIAAIISVPFQLNFDDNLGVNDTGSRTTINLQPVIPFSLQNGATIVTRTIFPYVHQKDVVPGTTQEGFGDILFSAWYTGTVPGGVTWGLGPVVRIPTGSDVSTDTWAAGVTGIGLKTSGPWTYGVLANHLWDIESDPKTPTSTTLVQPFAAYTSRTGWTYSLQSESTYDWEAEQWAIPVNVAASKLVEISGMPVSLQAGVGYWLESPEAGPEGVRFRLGMQFVFPR